MKPVYLDLHIHTSEDPNSLNVNYPIETLIGKIKEKSHNSEYLISLTDHNTINKSVYLKAVELAVNVILGVELHIRKYEGHSPYHCHIYFNLEISDENIDMLNSKLDDLYENKEVNGTDDNIPFLENIINSFEELDFILLPHGGQSHKTFDEAMKSGTKFDSAMERSIYYNQFDGFTARSNEGLEKTIAYFKKLGINEFVNLVTCTDNYNPVKYPESKSSDAKPYIPTWMLALPTFDGLRLSLSESSRFIYSSEKPDTWSEYIKSVNLQDDNIDIDVCLTAGLNVVIGGSSSGKTLFVDSLYRRIINDFTESEYNRSFDVERLQVNNPAGNKPHYIFQNYIIKVIDKKDSDNTIDQIDIIRNVFPEDTEIKAIVEKGLRDLKTDLNLLVDSVIEIEKLQSELERIPQLSQLIVTEKVKENLLKSLLPSQGVIDNVEYKKTIYEEHILNLDDISRVLTNSPFVNHNSELIDDLKQELNTAFSASKLEGKVRDVIKRNKQKVDSDLRDNNREQQSKNQDFQKLISLTGKYASTYKTFHKTLEKISKYSIEAQTQDIESMGHKLSIKNEFKLNKDLLLNVLNFHMRTGCTIYKFEDISPEKLFFSNYKQKNPKVQDYDDLKNRIYNKIAALNKREYSIIASDGRNFDNLSAGWKTSILLDLILGYEDDSAPLIIDQPEDNLATKYINEGLIKAIKKIKSKKQIILVSHNATIPMLGDAQNIVLCENIDNKIIIKSNRLESHISGKSSVEHIAEITDGGKASIKKRVKKYNLKNYKG